MRILAIALFCLGLAALQARKTPRPAAATCSAPTALPVKAASAGLAVAATERTELLLFQAISDGQTWLDVSGTLPEATPATSVTVQDGALYLGAENGGVYGSTNPEWGAWQHEELAITFPREVVNALYAGNLGPYARSTSGGLYRKFPGTGLWQPMHGTLPDRNVHAVVETTDGKVFIACHNGIFRSADDGKTWDHVFKKGWVTNLVSIDGALIGNGMDGLLRSTDGGAHWEYVLQDREAFYRTTTIDGRLTAVRIDGPWNVSAATFSTAMYTSADAGKTWNPAADLPFLRVNDLVQSGEFLFCSHKQGISRSADHGKTWQLVQPFNPQNGDVLRLKTLGDKLYAVRVRSGC